MAQSKSKQIDVFDSFKAGILNVDPVYWIENNLTLDGAPFRIHGNGYKPFSDIYRYVGAKGLERNSRPVVLVKGRQVGATTLAAAIECYWMASGLFGKGNRPPIRVMHCFPTLVHVYAYAKMKLNPMIVGANPSDKKNKLSPRYKSVVEAKLDETSSTSDSLQFKQFENGNVIEVESVGANADRLRGRTIDVMFFDEVQDIPGQAISAATKILSKARHGKVTEGLQVYLGTPKRKGSDYYKIWSMSSQQYYHLGCINCGEHFPLYTPGTNDWENIWLYGFIVQCTHCGFEQDKREAAEIGKWVAANDDENCKFVGFHINMLYNPEFTKERILEAKPENHPTNTERLYQNEVLGEFFAGEGGPISIEEIRDACADYERTFRKGVSKAENKKVYLGLDWGGKDDVEQRGEGVATQGQSYSCAVILTAETNNRLTIDFATRLKRNDPESKRGIVEQMFRQYSVIQAVGDIGYANDLSSDLQHIYGDRFLASQPVAKLNGKIKLNEDIFPKTILFEKDHYLSEIFGLFKKGAIRFPYGSYEALSWLIAHCASMDIKITQSRTGEPIRRFVKGTIQNDGLMALLNAYIAFKYDSTQGFKNNSNNTTTTFGKKNQILAVGGYIPKMR